MIIVNKCFYKGSDYMGIVTEKEYEVHYYEVDYNKRLLPTSLLDYMGDLSVYQSNLLNVGIKYLEANKMGWVIYKWDIDIKKYPLMGEKIKVRTNAYSFRKFYAYRKFEAENAEGEIVATAKTEWLLINTDRRRPIRISRDMQEAYQAPESEEMALKFSEIEKVQSLDNERVFDVRYSDIDTNRHVNNVKYVSWILETVPLEIIRGHALRNLKITYEKETTYGEIIKAYCQVKEQEDKIVCLHKIIDKDSKELTVAQTEWELAEK